MQRVRNLGQDLCPPVVFPEASRQAAGLEQTPQLSGQDGSFCRQVVIEEVGLEACRNTAAPNTSLETTSGAAIMDAGVELGAVGIAGGVEKIHKNRAPLADRFSRPRRFR